MHFEDSWQDEYDPLEVAFGPRHHLTPNDLRKIYLLDVGIDLVVYVSFDVLCVLLFHPDLVAAFQSNEGIVSAREANRNGSREAPEELNKLNRYVFTALVKRINVNSDFVRSCGIDHVLFEKSLQLFLVPVPFFPKLSLGLTSTLVYRGKF